MVAVQLVIGSNAARRRQQPRTPMVAMQPAVGSKAIAKLYLKKRGKPALPVPEFRVKNFVLSAKLNSFLLFLEQVTADTRKALFEELLWEHRELAEAHDKCQVIPEASIDALKEQLATAQREKDELSRQHQEELNALKTSYQELKSQLIQLGLDHE
nr:uncharacterized protein LOC127304423 [Lolium perenne]